jgi:hypothetical protein
LSQSVNGFVQSRPYATEHVAAGRVLIWGENRVFDLSEGEARVWDAATGKALSEPMKHEAAVSGAAFDEHGERVLT